MTTTRSRVVRRETRRSSRAGPAATDEPRARTRDAHCFPAILYLVATSTTSSGRPGVSRLKEVANGKRHPDVVVFDCKTWNTHLETHLFEFRFSDLLNSDSLHPRMACHTHGWLATPTDGLPHPRMACHMRHKAPINRIHSVAFARIIHFISIFCSKQYKYTYLISKAKIKIINNIVLNSPNG